MTTRLFAEADLVALYAIEEACFVPPLRFSRRLIRSLVMSEFCRTWVGVVDERLCGFAIVALMDDKGPETAYIWTIEVLNEYRRLGVARRLIERVEESAREAGLREVALHVSDRNEGAQALYERCGYLCTGTEEHFYGLNHDGFRYEKVLREI